jgi:hypothetical protein
MSVATSTLPQVLLKQYELLADRYAKVLTELDRERSLRKLIEVELDRAEELLVRYESAAPGETDPVPHHVNHLDG